MKKRRRKPLLQKMEVLLILFGFAAVGCQSGARSSHADDGSVVDHSDNGGSGGSNGTVAVEGNDHVGDTGTNRGDDGNGMSTDNNCGHEPPSGQRCECYFGTNPDGSCDASSVTCKCDEACYSNDVDCLVNWDGTTSDPNLSECVIDCPEESDLLLKMECTLDCPTPEPVAPPNTDEEICDRLDLSGTWKGTWKSRVLPIGGNWSLEAIFDRATGEISGTLKVAGAEEFCGDNEDGDAVTGTFDGCEIEVSNDGAGDTGQCNFHWKGTVIPQTFHAEGDWSIVYFVIPVAGTWEGAKK